MPQALRIIDGPAEPEGKRNNIMGAARRMMQHPDGSKSFKSTSDNVFN